MTLAPHDRLGAYEIISQIGAGGMGEVYRARDATLNRDVAIKVLPAVFAADPDRLARFTREARTLAALNHPHIAAIYGVEQSGDVRALVMELVEGDDLSAIIRRGPILVADALSLARQIADALEAAHDQGIVHRDLKPQNIKVTPDGTAKVLDFGLAKALDANASSATADFANSPTLTAPLTQTGVILGTAAYMAPEQAKGRPVDRRADIWSFGVVLFEMLGGRRAFDGGDASEILAAILTLEPDWSRLPADVPHPVRRLLSRCLEKDPKKRLRNLAEGMLQLEDALATPVASSTAANITTRVPRRPLWQRALPLVIAVGVTAAAIMGVDRWRAASPAPLAPVRFTVDPGKTSLASLSTERGLSISPDGSVIVFAANASGRAPADLWARRLDQLEAAPLRGATNAVNPVVSPDNGWLAFVDQKNPAVLKKVPMLGGPPTVLATASDNIHGLAWTDDDAIVLGTASGLMTVAGGGGTPVPLTKLAPDETAHGWPSVVRGTRVVLYCVSFRGGPKELAAVDSASGRDVRLRLPGINPRYAPSGQIVYATPDGALRAVTFDPRTMAVSGDPVPVAATVTVRASGSADFDIASDGRLVYVSGGADVAKRLLTWVDRKGAETPIAAAPPRGYRYALLSPDGTRLSLDIREVSATIWVWDLTHESSLLRLTAEADESEYAVWSTDSQQVFTSIHRKNASELYRIRADGTGEPEQLTSVSALGVPFPNAVTPDGKQLVFRVGSTTTNDLYAVTIGDRQAHPVLKTEHDEANATLSPDGKWIAFQSDLSGGPEVYVRPFPDTTTTQYLVSTGGGLTPLWSPTGREIFYLSARLQMMAVPVDTSHGFTARKPVALFDASHYFSATRGRTFDVSADGNRFIMIKPLDEPKTQTPITVVLHWTDELRTLFKHK